jgi:hypothetical protein
MDLMYLSTLDLPGSLISESRTSAPSYSQVSWLYQHVLTLYIVSPHTYSPYTQPAHVHTHPICRQPMYASENKVFLNPRISPSNLRATSNVRHFICIHKYLQENTYTICTSVFLLVIFVSYLYLHVALLFPYFRASSFKIISFCKEI